MTEKPLHVRVAEALGCAPFIPDWYRPHDRMWHCPDGKHEMPEGAGRLAEYDTDWSATGPLIEKYGIAIEQRDGGEPGLNWISAERICDDHDHLPSEPWSYGETPLIAVCNLILALKEAGKLIDTQDRKA